ncbi:MAG TPA: MFS transporter [Acetobacteraceae bacterium]|nr:MFS transporter [Acetobacteraceae bacterium]
MEAASGPPGDRNGRPRPPRLAGTGGPRHNRLAGTEGPARASPPPLAVALGNAPRAPRPNLRALLRARDFLRLWSIGGCVNAMRWFEVLAAALFTLDATGSGLAVAIVSAARTMPMLFLGAFAGVMSEAVDRKRILVIGQLTTAAASATVALLGAFGSARPWHVALAALVAGTVWSTEMSTRRRMVGESVPSALVPRALALDTLTNSVTRMIGPIIAGTLYQFAGLAGAFALSAVMYVVAAVLAAGLPRQQDIRRLVLSHVPRDLAEGFSYARGHIVISGVLMVTIAMNLLGFPYAALVAPIGRQHFMVSPALVGMMAAAESFGAFLGGLWLTGGDPPGSGRPLMVGGSLLFLACVALMPLAPVFPIACLLLVAGGFGSAAFANMQTSLIIAHAPPHVRSRLMGLLTVCIGSGPVGILLVGALASLMGPLRAVDAIELTGLVAVAIVGLAWRRRETRQPRLARAAWGEER